MIPSLEIIPSLIIIPGLIIILSFGIIPGFEIILKFQICNLKFLSPAYPVHPCFEIFFAVTD